jgi:hypothetical protein
MDPVTPVMSVVVAVLIGRGALAGQQARTRTERTRTERARTERAGRAGEAPARPGPVSPAAAWAACERAGWRRLLDTGRLRQVVAAPDPGNPGRQLVLAEHPDGAFGEVRVLLAVNAAPNPDGTHATVALPVPAHLGDAVAAAAWTYHDPDHPLPTTTTAYTRLHRRT